VGNRLTLSLIAANLCVEVGDCAMQTFHSGGVIRSYLHASQFLITVLLVEDGVEGQNNRGAQRVIVAKSCVSR